MRRFLYHTTTVLWSGLLNVSDRAGRYEYIRVVAISCFLYPLVAQLLLAIIFGNVIGLDVSGEQEYSSMPPGVKIYEALLQLIHLHALFAFITIAIRRLHDMGLSGYFLFVVILATVFALFIASELGVLKPILPGQFLTDMAISLFIFLILGIPGSSAKPNRWGERPSAWPPDGTSSEQPEQPVDS